jgi:hypothetical protein
MVLLLSLFLLFYQANDLPAAKLSAVDFSAVKQGKVEHDQGCFDFYSRQITFRVKNQSDKTIYIYGLKTNSYYPLGYLIRLDREKNQWLNPEYNISPRPYKEFMAQAPVVYVPDVYVLPPGRSMKFNDLAKEIYLGSRVKRLIYISFSRDEEPQMIISEEFILS